MPIRFRCQHCKQLLGIARRKAGTLVECPRCAGRILVPPEPNGHVPEPGEDADLPLFERPDFEACLDNPDANQPSMLGARPGPPPLKPSSQASAAPRPAFDVEPVDVTTLAPGHQGGSVLILSSRQSTWLALGVVVAIALAFAGGILVGRYLL